MVWKQDLAKLKQTLKEDGAPPLPPPKPKPKPMDFKPMEDEDALFLSAMGLKRAAPPRIEVPRETPLPSIQAVQVPAPEPGFAEALKDLRGLKPMASNPVLAAPKATLPPPALVEKVVESLVAKMPEPAPMPIPVPAEVKPQAPPPHALAPARIQLAAGMSVEVDGSLDLRHHSVRDAEERLKDRLADATMLSWRTFHLLLGPEPELHEAVQRLLDLGVLPVARYAQAPIPLGGAQAWILYLTHPEA